ncbi:MULTISPECIES: hypothetical protein [Rhizobium]|jgi:hypothetical protein|nr:hypothetical protein [Rhizobium ruizarguesonis]NEI32166.1 hypothetical protein [Rhizobium ruizarguesonis]
MYNMVLKWAVIATYASMTIIYGLHFAAEMKEAVPWFKDHRDGSDHPTKP